MTLSDSDMEYVFSAEVLIRPHMQVFPKCCADSDISSRKVYQKMLPDHSGEILTLVTILTVLNQQVFMNLHVVSIAYAY